MAGKSVVKVVDKRTVHTDALDILGRVITEDDKAARDAIHLAVEPVIAGEKLYAGQDIGRKEDGTFGIKGVSMYLGIVDPFIDKVIQPGEKFFLVIYPRKITALHHVWEHPDFPTEPMKETVKNTVKESVQDDGEYALKFVTMGTNKIKAIKAIRAVTNCGLGIGKLIAENTPQNLLTGVSYGKANKGYEDVLQYCDAHVQVTLNGEMFLEANKPESETDLPSSSDDDEDDDNFSCNC